MTRKDLLNAPARSVSIAVVDLEMTGLSADSDRVVEIAVVRADGSEVLLEYDTLVRPPIDMSAGAVRVSGITPEMLRDAPLFPEVAPEVEEVLSGAVLVAHNVPHDLVFLDREMRQSGLDIGPPVSLDTLEMSRRLFAFPRNNLAEVCERLKIDLQSHHRALADARATFQAYHQMLDILDPAGTLTVEELLDLLGALAPNSPYRRQMERRIRDAFRLKRTVIIDYISTSDPHEGVIRREVSIWKLKIPRIQGYCHLRGGERVFRLDRIRSVEITENTYEIPTFDTRI
ncbi:MAG: exonuclease domain-containing protein [Myxococcota bacterium]